MGTPYKTYLRADGEGSGAEQKLAASWAKVVREQRERHAYQGM